GRKHTLASGTCLFYRRKEASMLAVMGTLNAVVRPGRFFDGRCFDH
ncbi:glycosyltransferase family 2 protein, partial [Pseudomonas aeruginosa]|nr:glycosyltransferase family 2 protein [Pseudomonas aeruginosa]